MQHRLHTGKALRTTLAILMALSTPAGHGLALLALLFTPVALPADEITNVVATADSYMQQDAATTNFGTATTMHVQSRNGGRNRRSVIKFDLSTSAVPADASIKTSTMSLFLEAAPNQSRTHQLNRVTGTPDWTEGAVTWNNRTTGSAWTVAGGDFDASAISSTATGTTAGVTLNWNILADGTIANIPQDWLTNPSQNLGVLLQDQTGNSAATQLGQYSTRQNAISTRFPVLAVRYMRNVNLNAATTGPSEVAWTWTFPSGSNASNYDGVLFLKKAGSGASFTFNPADGTAYTAGTNLGNGEEVIANTSSFATLSISDENGADSVILPGTAYTYRAVNHDNTTITGAIVATPPHYATGISGTATTAAGGGTVKNWSYRTAAATLSPPALDPGNVVVTGSNDSRLHSMDATNGGRRYQPGVALGAMGGVAQSRPVLIPGFLSTADCDPITGGVQTCDIAYATSGDGRVYAFNSATGTQVWQSPVLGSALVGSLSIQLAAFSAAPYPHAFDLIVVGTRNTADTTNNAIYGLNGNTGAIVWTFQPGNLDIISSTPIIEYGSNSVWVTSRAGASGTQPSIWKLDTATTNAAGSLLQSVTLSALAAGNRHIDASPEFNLDSTYLFTVTTGGDLVAVEHANPLNVFTTNVGAVSGMGFPLLRNGAAAGEDDVFFSTSGGLHKRTFNRTTQSFSAGWNTLSGALGGTSSAPILSPFPQTQFVYVGVSDGRLKKISMADGSVVLSRDVNLGATIGDPSFDIILQRFYVGDTSGRIYSFDVF